MWLIIKKFMCMMIQFWYELQADMLFLIKYRYYEFFVLK